MLQIVEIINLPVNCYQTKLHQMHQCAMIVNQEKNCETLKVAMMFSQKWLFGLKCHFPPEMTFRPEITFQPEIVFWQEMAIWQ